MVKKRPSLQNLHLPTFLSRRSDSDVVQLVPQSSPSRHRSNTTTSTTSSSSVSDDSNSDLLDDDPFAADISRFSLAMPLSPTTPSSGLTTPYTPSSRSSEEEKTPEPIDEGDSMPIEPLHRLPLTPTNSLRHRPSRSRLSSSVHPLPCLHELETRLITVLDVANEGPRSAVAKAKAKRLPFEPWDIVPPSTPADEHDLVQDQSLQSLTLKALPPLPDASFLLAGEDEPTELAYAISDDDAHEAPQSTAVSPSHSSPSTPTGYAQDNMQSALYQCAPLSESQRSVTGNRVSGHSGGGRGDGRDERNGSFDRGMGGGGFGNGKGGGNDERRDKNNTGSRALSFGLSESSSSSSSEYSEEEDASDPYGNDSPSALRHTPIPQRYPKSSSKEDEDSDDDVPLAQRIPTALAAQRTIRRRAREERGAHHPREKEHAITTRETGERRMPRDRSSAPLPGASSSSAVAAIDLNRRLLELSTNLHPTTNEKPNATFSPSTSQQATVRPSRSVQRPTIFSSGDTPLPPVAASIAPITSKLTKSRPSYDFPSAELLSHSRSLHSHTPSRSTGDKDLAFLQQEQSLRRAATTATRSKQPAPQPALLHSQASPQVLTDRDQDATIRQRRRAQSLTRPSSASTHISRNSAGDAISPPPVPPLPLPPIATTSQPGKYLQRIFVTTSKKYTNVDMDDTMTAGDVVDVVTSRGELREEAASSPGDWMLWELANDSGMERPIRAFERPSDIVSSWNTEKRVNAFVLRKTPLCSVLSRDQIPGAPPLFSGYVEWESRKGRWNKRWMELRECSLFLAKKEKSKDEVFLCTLSTFDAYVVSSRHRSPKPFTFAVKSSDNATLFENPADYMHIFSCDAKSGQTWLEKILVTRSYVLQQERTVLFRNQLSNNNAPSNLGASTSGRKQIPATPLVSVGPPAATSKPTTTFEPAAGSLLAKHSG